MSYLKEKLVFILGILTSEDSKLTEACLRCVCSVFRHPNAPVELIFHDTKLVTHLLSLVMHSITNQICVTTVLGTATKVGPLIF